MNRKFMGKASYLLNSSALFVLFLSTSAHSQKYGIRAGYDTDIDQFLIGGQAELSKIAEIARFAPSIDLGFGNDLTTFAFNGDFRLFITPPKASATLYGGAGLTLLIAEPKGGDSDSDFGLTFHGGVKFGGGKSQLYNVEARLGVDKMPDLRLFFGIFF